MSDLILEADRLLLRPLVETDVDICTDLYTNPDVMRFIRAPKTVEKVAEEMPMLCRRGGADKLGIWCVIHQDSGEKIGTSILLPLPANASEIQFSLLEGNSFPDDEIQIGYMFRKAHWGQGHTSAVCRRLLRFAFEETPLKEVSAVIDRENIASQTVLTNAGFKSIGDRRAYGFDGVPGFKIRKIDWQK